MSDKASGTYLTLTDNSIVSNGSVSLNILVPMLTTKGKLGLNTVTATDFKKLVGYDITYNSNYIGLQNILETVSSIKVWRLNQNAKLANAYFDGTGALVSKPNCEKFEEITSVAANKLAVANLDVGNPDVKKVKFTPGYTVTNVSNNNPSQVNPQAFILHDVSPTEKEELAGNNISVYTAVPVPTNPDLWNPVQNGWYEESGDWYKKTVDTTYDVSKTYYERSEKPIEIYSGCKFYNSSDESMIGVICDDYKGEKKIYRVADGIIDYDVENSETGVWEEHARGTASWNPSNNDLTVTLQSRLSTDTFYAIRIIPTDILNWKMEVADQGDKITGEVEFSFDSESDSYWKNIDFSTFDVQVYFNGNVLSSLPDARDYFELQNGTNGDETVNPFDIDTSLLDTARCNIILMNGITDYKVVNRLGAKCDKLKIHLFADCPAYAHYVDAEAWKKKILNSKYIAIGSVPDNVEVNEDGKTAYIYPSVNYGYILANMYNTYGNLNYPPAGYTYGTINASDLIETDFELYADELKTNRINWQRAQNEGTSMWEQRTTYSLNSDLSYIAPVFIVDDLCDRIVSFERNYNFRYMTPTDLLNQESGLTSILEDFETRGFIYEWSLKVPSYKEAQKAGRRLVIGIEISVTKDSEVIEIGVVLNA